MCDQSYDMKTNTIIGGHRTECSCLDFDFRKLYEADDKTSVALKCVCVSKYFHFIFFAHWLRTVVACYS